ncbi:MAG: glycosyltransferase 87 family protein [Bacteroidota bacterium]
MIGHLKYGKAFVWVASSLLYFHIGYFLERTEFPILIFDITLLFILYYYSIKYFEFNWLSIVFFRIVLIASTPALSDDYFRFIWDGNLLNDGINPFEYLPSELTKNAIYDGLNSKHYYSVYPPLLQLVFGMAAFIAKGNVLVNIIILRSTIIFAEIGSIYLIIKILSYFKLQKNRALIYALNPLVIIELTGNIHFEGISIFFVLLTFFFLICLPSLSKYLLLSAISLACAALIKLLPLLFLPLIFGRLGWKRGTLFAITVGAFVGLAFIPFLNLMIIRNISESLNLYFQKFEFNASIYYLVKYLGIWINDNNPIEVAGPILSLIGFLTILWISFKKQSFLNLDLQFMKRALLILSIYFFMATTVHPWYLSTIVCFVSFTNFKYPLWWSFLVFLSYSAYQNAEFKENMWLIGFEYLVVLGLFYLDFLKNKNSQDLSTANP